MKFGPHGHYLGTWDAASALSLRDGDGTRALTDAERDAHVTEAEADVAVLTLPAWCARELDAIDWAGDGADETAMANERTQFTAYGTRMIEFLQFAGLALPTTCETRLVATTDTLGTAREPGGGATVFANVGSAPLLLTHEKGLTLRLRPGEACLARTDVVAVSLADADTGFGLHVEIAC